MSRNELRTNDEPNRILMEAGQRIQACYPNGTRIEAVIDGVRVVGTVCYIGITPLLQRHSEFFVIDTDDGNELPFLPSVHPHRVLP